MIFGLPGFYFCARIYDRMLKQRRFNMQFGTTFISVGYLSWWMGMMLMYLTVTLISFVPTLIVSILNSMSPSWKQSRPVLYLLLLAEYLPALMGMLIFLMFGFGNNAQIVYRNWRQSMSRGKMSPFTQDDDSISNTSVSNTSVSNKSVSNKSVSNKSVSNTSVSNIIFDIDIDVVDLQDNSNSITTTTDEQDSSSTKI
jgi:hypothetical protein